MDKIDVNEIAYAIFINQIQNGGEIADFWSELNEKLLNQFIHDSKGDLEVEGVAQGVYNISSEEWFIMGFKTAMHIKDLMN